MLGPPPETPNVLTPRPNLSGYHYVATISRLPGFARRETFQPLPAASRKDGLQVRPQTLRERSKNSREGFRKQFQKPGARRPNGVTQAKSKLTFGAKKAPSRLLPGISKETHEDKRNDPEKTTTYGFL